MKDNVILGDNTCYRIQRISPPFKAHVNLSIDLEGKEFELACTGERITLNNLVRFKHATSLVCENTC